MQLKHVFVFTLLCVTLLVSAVYGQSIPQYLFSGGLDGWTPGNGVSSSGLRHTGSAWGGSIYFDQVGNDCYIFSPETNFTGVYPQMVNVNFYPQDGNSEDHDMQLFWRTAAEGSFSADKSSPLTLYQGKNTWRTINLSINSPKWTGQTIKQFRLDFDNTNKSTRFIVNHVVIQNALIWPFDAGVNGWYAGNSLTTPWHTSTSTWPGCLVTDQTGDDAYLFSPDLSGPGLPYNYIGGVTDWVKVRLYPQNGTTAAHDMRVYWIYNGDSNWNSAKSVLVTYSGKNTWVDVYVPVGLNQYWEGQHITKLRLDFDQVNQGNRYIVDQISIVQLNKDTTAPTVPTGLNATVIPENKVKLTWAASTDATGVNGYKIFRDGVQIGTSISPEYTDATAQPCKTYSYTVSAYDSVGNNSALSAPKVVSVSGPDPDPPTNPSSNSRCGSGSVAFSATPASGCSIKWYNAATGGNVVSTANPYTPTLSATITYYAASVSSAGCESATRLAVTGTVHTLPNTPTDAKATPSAIGPGGSSTLSATVGNGEEVVWYEGSCGGTVVTSPVSPTETTTYYAKAKNTTTGCLSASCAQVTVTYIPDDEGPVLTNVSVTCSEVGGAPNYNFLKGTVTVEAEASDDSGVASVVFYIDDSETPLTMTLDQNTGKYAGTCTIDADWSNGQHSITVVATDIYNNESVDTKNFSVNKNEVVGLVGFEDSFVLCTRPVTFVLNGTDSRTLTLNFINGKAYYNFVDIPEITTISAKTQWHLRSRREVTMTKGQAEVNFLGPKVLRGGDLATPGKPMGDNVVNALDYAILRNNWGDGVAGDINGDGFTDNNDYLLMVKYLYVKGDEP